MYMAIYDEIFLGLIISNVNIFISLATISKPQQCTWFFMTSRNIDIEFMELQFCILMLTIANWCLLSSRISELNVRYMHQTQLHNLHKHTTTILELILVLTRLNPDSPIASMHLMCPKTVDVYT